MQTGTDIQEDYNMILNAGKRGRRAIVRHSAYPAHSNSLSPVAMNHTEQLATWYTSEKLP
jgi:hypothetical protein